MNTISSYIESKRLFSPNYIVIGVIIISYELFLGVLVSRGLAIPAILFIVVPFLLLLVIKNPMVGYFLFVLAAQFGEFSLAEIGSFYLKPNNIFMVLLIIGFFLNRLINREVKLRKGPVDIYLMFLISWMVISLFWSNDRNQGFYALSKIGYGLLVYYISINIIDSKKNLEKALIVWMLVGVFSGLAAIEEFMRLAIPHVGSSFSALTKWGHPIRSEGFYGGANRLGSFLAIAALFTYYKILTAETSKTRALYICTVGIMAVGLVTTLSRINTVGFFISSCFIAYCLREFRKPFLTTLATFLFIDLIVTKGEILSVYFVRLFYVFEGLEVSSPARVDIWNLALKTIRENPVLGVGLGGFPSVVQSIDPDLRLIYPHSLLMYIWAEMGILGLGIFFLFVGMTALYSYQLYKLIDNRDLKYITVCAMGTLLAYLSWSLFQNLTFQHEGMWMSLGLVMAVFNIASDNLKNFPKKEVWL